MRRRKAWYYQREPIPGVSVIGARVRRDHRDVRGSIPDVSVPKNAGRWIASVQHHMAQAGKHRSASAVDLMIAATAAHHGLTVLHDDADYRTVAWHASAFSEHSICDIS